MSLVEIFKIEVLELVGTGSGLCLNSMVLVTVGGRSIILILIIPLVIFFRFLYSKFCIRR